MLTINEVDGIKDDNKLIEKYEKLLKTRKLFKSENLKGKKLSKFWKLAKLGKKLSKIENLFKFDDKKNNLNFLIFKARIPFNYL